jgi:hypothetical protein
MPLHFSTGGMLYQTPDDGVRVLQELQEIRTVGVCHVAYLEWADGREIDCGEIAAHARQITRGIGEAAWFQHLPERIDQAVVGVARRLTNNVPPSVHGDDTVEVGSAAEQLQRLGSFDMPTMWCEAGLFASPAAEGRTC